MLRIQSYNLGGMTCLNTISNDIPPNPCHFMPNVPLSLANSVACRMYDLRLHALNLGGTSMAQWVHSLSLLQLLRARVQLILLFYLLVCGKDPSKLWIIWKWVFPMLPGFLPPFFGLPSYKWNIISTASKHQLKGSNKSDPRRNLRQNDPSVVKIMIAEQILGWFSYLILWWPFEEGFWHLPPFQLDP